MMTITLELDLTAINCGKCGGTYAINERYRKHKEQKGASWNCPYCMCSWGYSENEVQILRKELAHEKSRHDQQLAEERDLREQVERSRAAIKGQLTKTKKRVGKGVCPCCNRRFENLYKHMENKHPEYADDTGSILEGN